MTFAEFQLKEFGYEVKTTFWQDFTIAECFGKAAVRDTFNRAFKEWRTNIEYLTELVLVLNHKIWYWHEKNDELARLYDELWREADGWACEHITDPKDAEYYYNVLD